MADENNTEPTPGSDPSSSPHEPDAVEPTPGEGTPSGSTAIGPGAVPAAGPLGEGPVDEPDHREPTDAELAAQQGDEPRDPAAAHADADEDVLAAAERAVGTHDADDLPVDEPVLVGARSGSRPVRRQPETAESLTKKGRATRRKGEDDDVEPRTGPVTFVNESVGELRKVVWPTAEQMRTYFVVVLVFVVFMITVVSLLDLLFGWLLLQAFS